LNKIELNNKIMIIAGEASGDLHGAGLITAMHSIQPGIKFFGIGGDKMISAGMDAQFNAKKMAFLGFIEVLRHIPYIKKVENTLLNKIKEENIKTVILIDYPGFNLRFARKAKAMGLKIIYYISPQVWAWGKGRVKKIRELVDKMIVVFPFEEKFYKENGVEAVYVGHPLIERINEYPFLSKEELYKKFNLVPGKDILLLMPGSRKHEIRKIFSESVKASIKLAEKLGLQLVVACSENLDEKILRQGYDNPSYKIIKGYTYDLMKHSKFGIIKSGTSTLEAGILSLPYIVIYSTSSITYYLGRMVVDIKNLAITNILLEENVVEELIQNDLNEQNIIAKVEDIITSNEKYTAIKHKLERLKTILGTEKASNRAAKIIIEYVNGF
jgi:lipid-A-disaccharide synthase